MRTATLSAILFTLIAVGACDDPPPIEDASVSSDSGTLDSGSSPDAAGAPDSGAIEPDSGTCDLAGEPCTPASCCAGLVCEITATPDGETSECR